jgi:hypothetical protein
MADSVVLEEEYDENYEPTQEGKSETVWSVVVFRFLQLRHWPIASGASSKATDNVGLRCLFRWCRA